MPDQKPIAIGVDSCVLIELFDEKSPKRADIREIFADAENGKLTMVVSTMVHAEVAASSKKLKPWDIAEIRRALSQSYFEPVELSIPIALLASDIARETGLKPADAVHAATCVTKRVGHLLTIDEKLLKTNGKILLDATDRSKTLTILTPEIFCEQFYRPLFAKRKLDT
ncbi:MAG TPA: type II toxin-antitoxin system VapC family toxin [Tepidisphaeraceae bacterium]|jgi:predicted nucleic acid-binding protein|nr:type II toxin-antitoxin system VapC family toxin [Tepidisphaeraceae bacterium]